MKKSAPSKPAPAASKPAAPAAAKANPIARLGKFAHPPKSAGIINRAKR